MAVGFDLAWIETTNHWEPSDPSRILSNDPCQKHCPEWHSFNWWKELLLKNFCLGGPVRHHPTSSHMVPWSQVPLASSWPHHRSAAPWSAHKDLMPTKPLRKLKNSELQGFNQLFNCFQVFLNTLFNQLFFKKTQDSQSKLACSM